MYIRAVINGLRFHAKLVEIFYKVR
jgi:hypothetical protein